MKEILRTKDRNQMDLKINKLLFTNNFKDQYNIPRRRLDLNYERMLKSIKNYSQTRDQQLKAIEEIPQRV